MLKQLVILILILLVNHAGATTPVDTVLSNLLVKLQIPKADTGRVKLLKGAGEFYLFKPGEEKADLDSAYYYFNQALNLSKALHQPKFTYEILKNIGNYYVEAGELKKGTDYFMQSIQYYHQNHLFALEADCWGWLGDMYYNNGKNDHVSEQLIFYDKAKNIYLQLHDRKNATLVILQMATTHMSVGDMKTGIKTLTDLTTLYHKQNDALSEADTWFYLARALTHYDLEYSNLRVQAFINAYKLYMSLKKYTDAAEMLSGAASVHITKGLYKLAENEFLTVINLYKENDVDHLPDAYYMLAFLYSVTSDLDKEIAARLKGIESIRTGAKENELYYSTLSINYRAAGIKIKSKQYLQKAISFSLAKGDTSGYVFFLQMSIDNMIADGNAKQALVLLNHKLGNISHLNDAEKRDIADAYSSCYVALKQYKKAKPYIETLTRVFTRPEGLKAYMDMSNWEYYSLKIISYYIANGEFNTAEYYLKNADMLPRSVASLFYRSRFLLSHFKIDSAGKNYFRAIKYFQQYKTLNDSLISVEKIKRINELEIKYDAVQKDRTIVVLKSRGNAQREQVQKVHQQRNLTFGGIAFMLLVSGLVYNGYRNKKKSNQTLQLSQLEKDKLLIEKDELLTEKDDLLNEKEWLLKEVHHRVKNNLQIVMSLLSTQSAFLQNKAAISAIQESQNRVQAISLIHHKLYSTNNMASIDIQSYVYDLVGHLKDCFDTEKKAIRIEQVIEPIKLDLTHAVPLGLILNEGITNAIKYAFEGKGGEVIIGLQLIGTENMLLTIADNGKGFPADFDLRAASSLGMEMMKALTKQLGGKFSAKNQHGAILSIEFEMEKNLKMKRG